MPICLNTDCKKRPYFGLTNKKAQYCAEHKSIDMINTVSKTCIYADCKKHATYGKLFSSKTHCVEHRNKNEYLREKNQPKCLSENCKHRPFYTDKKDNYPIRCELHKIDNDLNVIEKKCVNCSLENFISNKNGMCNDCSDYIQIKATRRHYKEETVKKLLLENDFNIIHDKIPEGSCNKYRPDFILDCGKFFIIIECDEHQHSNYQCLCEQARMINIHQDIGGSIPVLFIRYNPDNYTDTNKTRHRSKNESIRHDKLISVLKSCVIHPPKYHLSVIYLYYDGHDDKKLDLFEIKTI